MRNPIEHELHRTLTNADKLRMCNAMRRVGRQPRRLCRFVHPNPFAARDGAMPHVVAFAAIGVDSLGHFAEAEHL